MVERKRDGLRCRGSVLYMVGHGRDAILLVASPGKGITDNSGSWEAGYTYNIVLFGLPEFDGVSSFSGSPTFSLLLLPGGG
jgi:hypothetical protein